MHASSPPRFEDGRDAARPLGACGSQGPAALLVILASMGLVNKMPITSGHCDISYAPASHMSCLAKLDSNRFLVLSAKAIGSFEDADVVV